MLNDMGAVLIRQKGSYQIWKLGKCTTIVPIHTTSIPIGTLKAIERQLAKCIGNQHWLTI